MHLSEQGCVRTNLTIGTGPDGGCTSTDADGHLTTCGWATKMQAVAKQPKVGQRVSDSGGSWGTVRGGGNSQLYFIFYYPLAPETPPGEQPSGLLSITL